MSDMTVADPIICRPYDPPGEHFELGADGSPSGRLIAGRRPSASFIPVPAFTKRRAQAPVQEAMDLTTDGERRPAPARRRGHAGLRYLTWLEPA